MSIFALGDLHLSFAADKPMDIYGGQWVGHVERIRENWLARVSEDDLVLLPGDISWAMKQAEAEADLRWIASLPGQKLLLKGNHDLWWTAVGRLNALDPSLHFLQNDHYSYGDYGICGCRGWICPDDSEFTQHDEKIYRREQIRLRLSLDSAVRAGKRQIIALMHFPPAGFSGRSAFTDIFEEYGVRQVVYGHLHGAEAQRKAIGGAVRGVEYRLVACDYLGCMPVKLVE